MSLSTHPPSIAQPFDNHKEQRNVEESDFSAIPCVRYKDLDKNNLIKCSSCRNYTDITCEQYNQDALEYWLGVMRISDDNLYICKHCRSAKESLKKMSSLCKTYLEKLKEMYEKNAIMSAGVDKIEARAEDLSAKIDRANERVEVLSNNKKIVSNSNVRVETNNHEKSISDSSARIDLVIPITAKEVVPSLHPPTKIGDTPVCPHLVGKNYIRKKRLVFIGVPKDMDDKTFIKELSEELNLGIDENRVIKTFRIKAKNIPAGKTPPLNVEFRYANDKLKIYNQETRDKITNLPPHSKFHDVKFFPDRSYKHRKKYKELKFEMDARNSALLSRNVKTLKWIIKSMSLTKVIDLGGGVKTK